MVRVSFLVVNVECCLNFCYSRISSSHRVTFVSLTSTTHVLALISFVVRNLISHTRPSCLQRLRARTTARSHTRSLRATHIIPSPTRTSQHQGMETGMEPSNLPQQARARAKSPASPITTPPRPRVQVPTNPTRTIRRRPREATTPINHRGFLRKAMVQSLTTMPKWRLTRIHEAEPVLPPRETGRSAIIGIGLPSQTESGKGIGMVIDRDELEISTRAAVAVGGGPTEGAPQAVNAVEVEAPVEGMGLCIRILIPGQIGHWQKGWDYDSRQKLNPEYHFWINSLSSLSLILFHTYGPNTWRRLYCIWYGPPPTKSYFCSDS